MEIETSYDLDTGEPLTYYARGHHDPAVFFAEASEWTTLPLSVAYVRHAWWRNVPNRDGGLRFLEAGARARGAYPVTVLDLGRYRGDRALFGILAKNSLNLETHYARCCCPEARCEFAEELGQLIERQSADLEAAQLRLGERASAERWADLIERAEGRMREHLVSLAPRLSRCAPVHRDTLQRARSHA